MKIAHSLAIVTATFLAGCSGAGLGGAGDALDTKPISSRSVAQPAAQPKNASTAKVTPPAAINPPKQGQVAMTANANKAAQAGQQDLPGQQYMSNQVLRSLRELTAKQPDTPYPVIADAPPQKRRLLTPEERAKLEQELRDLSE